MFRPNFVFLLEKIVDVTVAGKISVKALKILTGKQMGLF